MKKYKNKYRIQSHRLPGWDYSAAGMYYITLITQYRECKLGVIYDGRMELSDFGEIVDDEWLKSFEIRRELILDEYIIMPNHLHAIVKLIKPIDEMDVDDRNVDGDDHNVDAHDRNVETHGRASLQSLQSLQSPQPEQPAQPDQPGNSTHQRLHRQPKSISSFIAGYKSSINTKIDDYIDEHQLNIPKYNKENHFFQPNYHDRIIRNEIEYRRIKKYIIENPSNWIDDAFNK